MDKPQTSSQRAHFGYIFLSIWKTWPRSLYPWRIHMAKVPLCWTLFGELSVSLDTCVCYGPDLEVELISTTRLQKNPQTRCSWLHK